MADEFLLRVGAPDKAKQINGTGPAEVARLLLMPIASKVSGAIASQEKLLHYLRVQFLLRVQ
jgi:hypothetical protein